MLRGEFINGNKEFIFKLKFYFLNTIVYKMLCHENPRCSIGYTSIFVIFNYNKKLTVK